MLLALIARCETVRTWCEFQRAALLAAATTVVMYLPVVMSSYGISDDYVDLLWSTRNNTTLPDAAMSGGRPVSGFFQEIALSLATDVSSLRWLRLVGLLGVAATALLAAVGIGWFTDSPWIRWAAGVGVAAVPANQVVAAWAVLFPVSWGVAMALGTGLALRRIRTTTWRSRSWLLGVAVVGISTVIGMSNYQPSAMAMWVGVLLASLDTSEAVGIRVRRITAAVSGFGIGMIVYLALTRVLTSWRNLTADTRASLEVPGSSKLAWFIREVAPRSLDPLSFKPRPLVAAVAMLAIVVGLALRPTRAWERLFAVLAAVVCIPLTYLPTLGVIDRWPSARSRLALDVAVAILAALALCFARARWAQVPRRSSFPRAISLLSIGGAMTMGAMAAWRVQRYYVEPQALEYRIVSEAVRQTTTVGVSRLVIVRATWDQTFAPTVDLDEFGLPSMSNTWGPRGLVEFELLRNGQPLPPEIWVVAVDQEQPTADLVIDISAMYAAIGDLTG